MLPPEQSALQRDQLLADLKSLASLDEAAAWAKRTLPVKNTLTADHARDVETAFADHLARFGDAMASPHGWAAQTAMPKAAPRRPQRHHRPSSRTPTSPSAACGGGATEII